MLQVLEVIQEHRITVMLARETFDPKIAPLKAWEAQRMAGEAFEIPVPPILDQATYECFLQIRKENKMYPVISSATT